MKSVLISIQPKWCELIASGKKTVEVRKTMPKLDVPFKCYIYCTANKQGTKDLLEIHGTDGKIRKANSKVIGEFVCNNIECFTTYYRGSTHQTREISKKSCVSLIGLWEYESCSNCLYGWHITDLVIYDKPKELSEFHKPIMPTGLRYEDDTIARPPQSWCYVESEVQGE